MTQLLYVNNADMNNGIYDIIHYFFNYLIQVVLVGCAYCARGTIDVYVKVAIL